jgi:hypothetical protein
MDYGSMGQPLGEPVKAFLEASFVASSTTSKDPDPEAAVHEAT